MTHLVFAQKDVLGDFEDLAFVWILSEAAAVTWLPHAPNTYRMHIPSNSASLVGSSHSSCQQNMVKLD